MTTPEQNVSKELVQGERSSENVVATPAPAVPKPHAVSKEPFVFDLLREKAASVDAAMETLGRTTGTFHDTREYSSLLARCRAYSAALIEASNMVGLRYEPEAAPWFRPTSAENEAAGEGNESGQGAA